MAIATPTIGKLRHRVQLQRLTLGSRDSYGTASETWSDEATVWGSVEPLSGRELWQAQQVSSNVTHTITIRYRPGVSSRLRAIHRGRIFGIDSVLDWQERRQWLQLLCIEAADVSQAPGQPVGLLLLLTGNGGGPAAA